MNGANEKTVDDGTNNNTALADASIDKNAVVVRQLQSVEYDDDDHVDGENADVDDVIGKLLINGSIQQHQRQQQQPKQQIDPGDESTRFARYASEYLAQHPGAIVVQPNNRTDNMDYKFRYSFPKANNIEFVVHLLDINPYANWLFVNATSISGQSVQLNLTEHIEPPQIKRNVFSDVNEIFVHFWFMNSEWSRYRGFFMTIQPNVSIDGKLANTSETNDLRAHEPTDSLTILIGVTKSKQNNETWKLFRVLLANSTNKFIDTTDVKVEKCSENDVTFINILPCQSAWPNAQNCVEIDFAIQLKSKSTMQTATNQTNVEETTHAMKHDDLVRMWADVGRKDFADNGYQEFPVPNTQRLLFIWGTVSLMVVGAFLLVLVLICKMDLLRDYRRMYWGGNSDDIKQICKPTNGSMYPPVHQIVPTLFPNDLTTSNNLTNAIPFECVNRPITFDAGDFKRRQSLEETLTPSENVKRKAGEVPFQSDIEFNGN